MNALFDQLFPAPPGTVFSHPREIVRIELPNVGHGQPLKQWHREHKWCWCPQCAMQNPRGARVKIDIGLRHCGECGALLFRALDSGALDAAVPPDYPWFMRMVNGPRGTGWYRRRSIEILYGQG